MKSILFYLKENKVQSIDLFKDLDPNDFKWESAYSDDDYQKKCKEEVKKFANELYTDLKPIDRIEQLYKDSYKQFLSNNTKLKPEKIDELYDHNIELINKMGWAQLEAYSLEQGWWVFMYWVKKNIKELK